MKNWSLFADGCYLGTPIMGWGYDEKTVNFEDVLYVELPRGQYSFHSGERLDGPDFRGDWGSHSDSTSAILKFCEMVEKAKA